MSSSRSRRFQVEGPREPFKTVNAVQNTQKQPDDPRYSYAPTPLSMPRLLSPRITHLHAPVTVNPPTLVLSSAEQNKLAQPIPQKTCTIDTYTEPSYDTTTIRVSRSALENPNEAYNFSQHTHANENNSTTSGVLNQLNTPEGRDKRTVDAVSPADTVAMWSTCREFLPLKTNADGERTKSHIPLFTKPLYFCSVCHKVPNAPLYMRRCVGCTAIYHGVCGYSTNPRYCTQQCASNNK